MIKHLLLKRTALYPHLVSLRESFQRNQQVRQWRAAGEPIPPPPAVKHSIIIDYAKKFRIEVLIETGTYLGDTIAATRKQFGHVYSIELSQDLHEHAKQRFADDPTVTLLLGDSASILKNVLREIRTVPLFWLDAHYSGGCTARGKLDTPIIEELNTIFSLSPDYAVLIDDARLFNGTNSYPTLMQLRNHVAKRAPTSYMEIEHDIIRLLSNSKGL